MNNNYKNLSFFSGKKIFITGHTGFKGSWLSYILTNLGADVLGYSLPPLNQNSHFEILGLAKKIHHVEGDICDLTKLKSVICDFEPEFVFHLAAQALVAQSYQEPCTTILTNVCGSANLLDAVRECESIKSLIYVTSDKCYENQEWIWGYRESDILGGADPYSASKGAAELIFSAYLKSFFQFKDHLGAASVRAGNVIGGGDWSANRIVPDFIRAIQNKSSITLRNPGATRPWQHVLEPLSGYMMLALALYDKPQKWSGSWNFGPDSARVKTVKELTEYLASYLGQGDIVLGNSSEKFHEARLLQLNCDKAHQLLGWFPRWSSDESIEQTAYWYKQYLSGENMENITKAQIKEYFEVKI